MEDEEIYEACTLKEILNIIDSVDIGRRSSHIMLSLYRKDRKLTEEYYLDLNKTSFKNNKLCVGVSKFRENAATLNDLKLKLEKLLLLEYIKPEGQTCATGITRLFLRKPDNGTLYPFLRGKFAYDDIDSGNYYIIAVDESAIEMENLRNTLGYMDLFKKYLGSNYGGEFLSEISPNIINHISEVLSGR